MKIKKMCGDSNYRYIAKEAFIKAFYDTKLLSPESTFEGLDVKQKHKLDIFQLMSILIWTSFATNKSKLRCILKVTHEVAFALFDMDKNSTISFEELEIFFVASCKGLARFLGTRMSANRELKEVAIALFCRYDLNKNYSLEIDE